MERQDKVPRPISQEESQRLLRFACAMLPLFSRMAVDESQEGMGSRIMINAKLFSWEYREMKAAWDHIILCLVAPKVEEVENDG